MKRLLGWFLLAACAGTLTAGEVIVVTDLVRIKDGHRAEALYFYEQNWKAYRDEALARNGIRSFRLIVKEADGKAPVDLVLETEFENAAQFAVSEEMFRAIMDARKPAGPRLLNALKPAEFREIVFSVTGRALFEGANK